MPIAELLRCFGWTNQASWVQLVLLYLWYEGGAIETEHPVYVVEMLHLTSWFLSLKFANVSTNSLKVSKSMIFWFSNVVFFMHSLALKTEFFSKTFHLRFARACIILPSESSLIMKRNKRNLTRKFYLIVVQHFSFVLALSWKNHSNKFIYIVILNFIFV